MTPQLPGLVRPPIVEVVCGVKFEPIPALDSLRHGLYWARIRERYPRAEAHPLLTNPNARIVSEFPLQRTWFVSGDDEVVIQLQFDRFYVNWRKRHSVYPRFDGDEQSVYRRFEREFDGFRVFLRDLLDVAPRIEGIELSKVDVLDHPADWVDINDLGVMIPRLRSAVRTDEILHLNVNVGTAYPIEDGVLHTAFRTVSGPSGPRIHAEFRLTTTLRDEELETCFTRANGHLNAAFLTEFPDAEQRFGTRVQ